MTQLTLKASTYKLSQLTIKKPDTKGVGLLYKERFVYKPGSVTCEQVATIHLGLESLQGSSDLPVPNVGHVIKGTYLVLLRVGFTVPRTVTSRAVRSYRTLSPLPVNSEENHRRYTLCCTGRRLAPPRRYLAPCPVEPGLSSPNQQVTSSGCSTISARKDTRKNILFKRY